MKRVLLSYVKITLYVIGICLCLSLAGCNDNLKTPQIEVVEVNSVPIIIKRAQDKKLDKEERKNSLLNAYLVNKREANDSIRNKYLRDIAFEAYKLSDSAFFIKTNTEALELSQLLQDTLGIGDAHWNFGSYYSNIEDLEKSYSHYYQAHKFFETVNHRTFSGRMLFNMAVILNNAKDYTGSEILTFQAIERFREDHNNDLYRCYNNLGIVFKNLRDFGKAIEYHNEALNYLNKIRNKRTFIEGNQNNIGLVYQEQGSHEKAIVFFKNGLKNDSLKFKNLVLYNKLFDNLTYSRFKIGETNLEVDFLRALKIRDSLKDISGVVLSKLHLAEYYVAKADSVKAISFAQDAYSLATTVNNHRDRLAALKLLAEFDPTNSTNYQKDYITLNDSLQIQDRAIRNKFTRIRYETGEYVQETERLATQNILISIIGTISVILISLLYFLKRQSAKNKALLFEKDQQKANEEIYELMLQQQQNLEQGRLEERYRISEDLHDGVLGRLFGTRVGLGFLDIDGDKGQLEKHQIYIDEIQDIEKEIRDISHELKSEVLSSKADFSAIIEDFIKPLSELHLFEYKINNEEGILWDTIDDKFKVSMYRIIQEAIQNVIKHASASSIIVNFYLREETLHLSIIDDGLGFDVKKHKKGIGHKNMKARVAKLNGTITINSTTKEGATITVAFQI